MQSKCKCESHCSSFVGGREILHGTCHEESQRSRCGLGNLHRWVESREKGEGLISDMLFHSGSNHFGIAGYYSLMAMKEGLIVRTD